MNKAPEEVLQNIKGVSLDGLSGVADMLLAHCQTTKTVLFYGEMGVGKTTLINAICQKLKVQGTTSSPTFSIVNEYLTASAETVYHFDFYRLKTEMEALDLGYEEYLYSGNYCFIEWPEKIENLLPEKAVEVHMEIVDSKREIVIKNR